VLETRNAGHSAPSTLEGLQKGGPLTPAEKVKRSRSAAAACRRAAEPLAEFCRAVPCRASRLLRFAALSLSLFRSNASAAPGRGLCAAKMAGATMSDHAQTWIPAHHNAPFDISDDALMCSGMSDLASLAFQMELDEQDQAPSRASSSSSLDEALPPLPALVCAERESALERPARFGESGAGAPLKGKQARDIDAMWTFSSFQDEEEIQRVLRSELGRVPSLNVWNPGLLGSTPPPMATWGCV
jgi:hypothetical protein